MKKILINTTLHKALKTEKGSVTLFVLIAMIFFLFVTINIYINSQNKLQSQNTEIAQIKKNYEKSNYNEYLEDIYNEITQNTVIINYSFDGGNYAMPTTGKAKISTKISIENQNPKISIKEIYYQWSNSANQKPDIWLGQISNNTTLEKNDCETTTYYLWIKTIDNNGNESFNVSKPFIIQEANIDVDYTKNIIASPLNININFDSILTTGYKFGIGKTESLAKNSKQQINVNNNTANVNLNENSFIYIEATDNMGNLVYKVEEITNIDNEGPLIELNPDGGNYELVYEYI